MKKRQGLLEMIKKEGLVPDPSKPGRFIRQSEKDKLGFLSPNNWVFHTPVVQNVLKGNYMGIRPYSGEFVATMNCSNRCAIPCAYEVPKRIEGVWEKNDISNPRVHMPDIDFAKTLIDKLIEGGIKGIIFTGGGEPFLFKGLEDVVGYCRDNDIDTVVYSNGNALSQKRIDKIIEAEPLLIRVSLNCGTEEVYNRFHKPLNPKGALQRTLNSIEAFARGALENPDITFGIGVVINEINQYDLVETAERVREIAEKTGGGIDFVTYRPGYNYYSADQLTKDLLGRAHETVETDVRKILDDVGVKLSNISSRYSALVENTRNYDACRASGLYFELSPSGALHLCCDRNCHRDYVIGNLAEQSLAEVWEGKQRREVIEKINSGSCSECPPACKPHLTNLQFSYIEYLRDHGEMYKAELWVEEQRKMPKPKMVNF